MSRNILVVVDMQKDFVDGALGTKEAQAIVPRVKEVIESYERQDVYATKDTHQKDYLNTREGKYLPVEHCVENEQGWQFNHELSMLETVHIINKPTFGSWELAAELRQIGAKENVSITLIGLCTDICVVSNALLIKAALPEADISVYEDCCAGVTPESHEAALLTMKMCQIQIKRWQDTKKAELKK